MPIIKNKPVRKTVFRGERSLNLDTFETVIVSDEIYKTNGENTDKIKIKTLTNCTIIPDIGRIDEDWDEISIGRGACVELQNVNGIWYILSSDGIKLD